METADKLEALAGRREPIEMEPQQFRELGHELVDRIADFMAEMPGKPVTPGETVRQVREALGQGGLPESGSPAQAILQEATNLLFDHSLFIGHPRFYGFITSAPAPIGALADLLAASVNPNLGGWPLSPMATSIELQTVRWIAELLNYPADSGGILVSGGNMANFVGFLVGRKRMASWDVRADGINGPGGQRLRVYASKETHTWVNKAADLFGLGTTSIRWIPTDSRLCMRTDALRQAIEADLQGGEVPAIVVGTGGSVSTGAIDPLFEIAAICREYKLWFHVDGAYGGFAAALPDCPPDLKGLSEADSVAIDPHKWLYTPIEAGCALVRDRELLHDTFSFHPPYYHMGAADEDEPTNLHEYGPQNTRGFRALKVWLGLRQVGREGYIKMISDDIALSEEMFRAVQRHTELEGFTQDLSIATFRFVPADLADRKGSEQVETYLNKLNTEVLNRLQAGGEVFLSNAVIEGRFLLRACIVNFRTSLEDVRALPDTVVRAAREVDAEMRPADFIK